MAFRFRQFTVYNDAKLLHKDLFILVSQFNREHWYIADQIKRSSLSVILNIAEGSSKQSDKDFNRYLSIALGSKDEVMATLDVMFEQKLFNEETLRKFEDRCLQICNQLGGFSKHLKSK